MKAKVNCLLILSLLVATFLSVKIDATHSVELGYELLNGAKVLRIWNSRDSYYFNVSSGMQFSNHYQEYWSHNVMGVGYRDAEGVWHKVYWTDELSNFNKKIDSDNLTFINATLWKDLSYSGYDFRLAIRYHLGVNDTSLTVQPYIKNLGLPIPFQLGFAWRLKDIKIANTVDDDRFKLWKNASTTFEEYFLNETLDKKYVHINTTGFEIYDIPQSKYLLMEWSPDLQNRLIIQVNSVNGQYNAPVTVFINIGTLASGQEKTTQFLWKDASSTTCTSDYVVEDDSVGTEPWDDEADAEGDPDSTGATCDLLQNEESYYLRATKFGFHEHTPIIPDSATIDGIKVEIRRRAVDGVVWEEADGIRVLKNGEPTDAEDGIDDYYGLTWDWSVGGGPTSLWDGEPWTVADIKNDTGFGVLYYVRGDSVSPQAQVDCFRVTVYYTSVVTPTVTTQDATGVGTNVATLHGTITDTGGENCDERGFDYDNDTSGPPYAYSWTESGSYGTGAFSHQIINLSPNTMYYFRAKAHNTAGWGYGTEKTFTTLSDVPSITNPELWDSGEATDKNNTNLDVQTEYHLNFTITDNNALADLDNVTTRIWQSSLSTENGTDAQPSHYTFTWSESSDTWASAPSGYCIVANCKDPGTASSKTSYEFTLAFNLSKVARYAGTPAWKTSIFVWDDSANADSEKTIMFGVLFYTEITITDSTHTWSSLTPSSNNTLDDDQDVDFNVIANDNWKAQAKGNGSLTEQTTSNTIPLSNLRFHKDTLTSSTIMTTSYQDVGGLETENPPTDEGSPISTAIMLWLTIPEIPSGDYVYELTIKIEQAVSPTTYATGNSTGKAQVISLPPPLAPRPYPKFDLVWIELPEYIITIPWLPTERIFRPTYTIYNTQNYEFEVVVDYWIKNEDGESVFEKTESYLLAGKESRQITLEIQIPRQPGTYTAHIDVTEPATGLTKQTFQVYSLPQWFIGPGLFVSGLLIMLVVIIVVWGAYRLWWS